MCNYMYTWDVAAMVNEIGWDHGHVSAMDTFFGLWSYECCCLSNLLTGLIFYEICHTFCYVFIMDFFRWNIKPKKPIQLWTLLHSHHHHWDHHRHFLLCNHRYKHVSCPFPTITTFHFPCLPLVNSELLFFLCCWWWWWYSCDLLFGYFWCCRYSWWCSWSWWWDCGIFHPFCFFSLFPLYFHHHHGQKQDSFADLARLLSEFFRDLDVVPSDVVVGLLLLRRLQRLEQCSIVKQVCNFDSIVQCHSISLFTYFRVTLSKIWFCSILKSFCF